MKEKICFVIKRYALALESEPEHLCRTMAEYMAQHYDVTVLTTCAINATNWANHFPQGIETINHVQVIRFAVDYTRDTQAFSNIHQQIFKKGDTSPQTQQQWVNTQGPYCAKIPNFIQEHANHYSAFIFFEYEYYPTFMGISAVSHKSILVPLLGNTPCAHMDIFKTIFTQVKAILYLAPEEKTLANTLFSNSKVPSATCEMGMFPSSAPFPCQFAHLHAIHSPYILYLGTIDESENCKELFTFWHAYKKNTKKDIKLVLIGQAIVKIPVRNDILHFPHLAEKEKKQALAEALFVWYPNVCSVCSSAIVQAMACGAPILVNAQNLAMKGRCERSNAGLYYFDFTEFSLCVNLLQENSLLRQKLGAYGKTYIQQFCLWPIVWSTMQALINTVKTEISCDTTITMPLETQKKVGIVLPWFGKHNSAEIEEIYQKIANQLQKNNTPFEILTTCANENGLHWSENYYPETIETIHNIPVRRFLVEPCIDAFYSLDAKLQEGQTLTPEEEDIWLCHFINSDRLYSYIRANRNTYTQFLFAPSTYSTTYFGSAAAGEKALLVANTTQNVYTHMQWFRTMCQKYRFF